MDQIILFIFLILFPFGQIIRIGIIQPIDVVVGLGAFWAIAKHYKRPEFFKYLEAFLLVLLFSWFLGAALFWQKEIFYGFLYLARIFAYSYFFLLVWNFVKNNPKNKNLVGDSLIVVSITSAIFGWIQFFLVPSFRAFFEYGWDEHLFRLAGAFLDPGYLGIILVFGFLVSVFKYLQNKKMWYGLASIFLIISVGFTYSRASYLGLFAGLLVIAIYKKLFKPFLLLTILFIGLVLILPTKGNTILSFTRQFSAVARVDNYIETLKIFKFSPVFGVGYDNLCIAKNKIIMPESFSSHSCSGSDSSLLFVLATTGIVGFVILVFSVQRIGHSVKRGPYYILLTTSFASLLVHSLFSNSMFYPWVMGWIAILIAVTIDNDEHKSTNS